MSKQTIIGNADLIMGTVDIMGQYYGQVEQASIELTGDEEGVPDDSGGFQAFILSNDQYKVSVTTIVPKSVPMPTRGARVDVPALGVACSVLNWRQERQAGKPAKLIMTLSHWFSIGGALGVGPTVTTLPLVAAMPPDED